MDEKNSVIEETGKTYQLRNLMAEDVFPMFQIISKIGVKEFKQCFESEDVKAAIANVGANGKADMNAIGLSVAVDIASVLMKNLPNCKDEIYQFLSGLSGMNKKAIAAMPMVDFIEMIVDVVKKDEFRDFFRVVSKLFK